MAVTVRRPAGAHASRRPDVAVVRVGAPGAVGIKVLIADQFGRHIARGQRIVAAAVAFARPAIQIIVAPRCHAFIVGQTGAVEAIPLLRIERIRRAFSVRFALSALHRHHRRVAVRIHIDAIFAGAAQGKCEIRCIHLKHLVPPHAAHPHFQRAL